MATCSGVRLVYSANPGANLDAGLESFHWEVSLSVLHMYSYCECPTLPGQFRKRSSCHSILPDLKQTWSSSVRKAVNFPLERKGSPSMSLSSFAFYRGSSCSEYVLDACSIPEYRLTKTSVKEEAHSIAVSTSRFPCRALFRRSWCVDSTVLAMNEFG